MVREGYDFVAELHCEEGNEYIITKGRTSESKGKMSIKTQRSTGTQVCEQGSHVASSVNEHRS